MPQSIPAGLTREHLLKALANLDAGIDHPFGSPTGYELVHEDKRYPPKALIGLACRYAISRLLRPHEFSGGEAPGQANFVLRKLGFTVVKKNETEMTDEAKKAGLDWSEQEVRLILANHFAKLKQEIFGKDYNKTEHRKALNPQSAWEKKAGIGIGTSVSKGIIQIDKRAVAGKGQVVLVTKPN